MTADIIPSATLLILSSEIVKSPDQVQNQINHFSSESEIFHHQLLERLTTGTFKLNSNYYSHIHIADVNGSNVIVDDKICDLLYESAKNGCRLTGQIDVSSSKSSLPLLIAGFVKEGDEFVKHSVNNGVAPVSVSLKKNKKTVLPRFKRALQDGEPSSTVSISPSSPSLSSPPYSSPSYSSPSSSSPHNSSPYQSTIVKLNLDDDDDDLIDENDLMNDEPLPPAIILPSKCDPGPGRKRRKACKDCTCGLKELEEQELEQQQQNIIQLESDDMAEIDFTIPGKAVGGCGSCALGDAFRCDGCPYLGLPPFKPGEVVSIMGRGDDL